MKKNQMCKKTCESQVKMEKKKNNKWTFKKLI